MGLPFSSVLANGLPLPLLAAGGEADLDVATATASSPSSPSLSSSIAAAPADDYYILLLLLAEDPTCLSSSLESHSSTTTASGLLAALAFRLPEALRFAFGGEVLIAFLTASTAELTPTLFRTESTSSSGADGIRPSTADPHDPHGTLPFVTRDVVF